MTEKKKRRPLTDAEGRALYRELIGPMHDDEKRGPYDSYQDTPANRFALREVVRRGGKAGAAARAKLAAWDLVAQARTDDGFRSGRGRDVPDPFDGPPAA
ncbi:hypothetical protein [Streptomyces fradiae]|uniref:hypothetical protein n=1 Tax=Streptomyces fradiae TaxID=1906 RepID=UPI0037B940C9